MPKAPARRKYNYVKPHPAQVHTPEIAAEICRRVALGQSLTSICTLPGMPDERIVREWVIENKFDFREPYERALKLKWHRLADELLDIADEGRNDTYIDDDGNTKIAYDVIARARLRVDTRKWILQKMLPKVYGERLDLINKPVDEPEERVLNVDNLTPEERELFKQLLLKIK